MLVTDQQSVCMFSDQPFIRNTQTGVVTKKMAHNYLVTAQPATAVSLCETVRAYQSINHVFLLPTLKKMAHNYLVTAQPATAVSLCERVRAYLNQSIMGFLITGTDTEKDGA
jgi:hypothetical protein